jgi:glycosyltransferase involved in cell wall biosynthesis
MCHQNFLNGIPEPDCEKRLTKEFVDKFDCIIVVHKLEWIKLNWEYFKSKLVILRTIGQNTYANEVELKSFFNKGVKIIRYSPKERELKNYAGETNLIRFLKYKSDFKNRNVINKNAMTFGQNVKNRKNSCFGICMEMIFEKVPYKLYGPENENYVFNGGRLSYKEQIEMLSNTSVYFYTGTYPAQYTLNFLEAMLSGIPIVSIGVDAMQDFCEPFPIEVMDILDSVHENLHFNYMVKVSHRLNELIQNESLNDFISKKQLKIAYNLFSAEKNKYQWNDFLYQL